MAHGVDAAPGARGEPAAPLLLAHRGAWGPARRDAAQNSLASLDAAVAAGCDGVEVDVRRTADGQLVLLHDPRIGLRPVSRLSHDQVLAKVRAGQAPLLTDALDRAAGRLLVDIEIKAPGFVEEVLEAVTSRLAADRFVITSFRARVLAEVRATLPSARTGLLVSPRGARGLEGRWPLARADFVAPHVSLAAAGALDWAAAHGARAWVWTVNDEPTLRRLAADARVEAIITDRPSRARGLISVSALRPE